jgi:ketosteroid isomerase-like protein
MSTTETVDILAIADRLFRAIEQGDVATLRELYSPDIKVWHNFDQREQNIDENLATLEWLMARLTNRRYDVSRRDVIDGGFLQLHVLRGTTRSGADFALPAAIVVSVTDGKVTRIDEYLDVAGAGVLRD